MKYSLNRYDYSPTELLTMVKVPHRRTYERSDISIGMALEHLHSLSTIGDEFEGGADGLDALTYHLSGSMCKNAIIALQKVLQRFDDLEADKKNSIDTVRKL